MWQLSRIHSLFPWDSLLFPWDSLLFPWECARRTRALCSGTNCRRTKRSVSLPSSDKTTSCAAPTPSTSGAANERLRHACLTPSAKKASFATPEHRECPSMSLLRTKSDRRRERETKPLFFEKECLFKEKERTKNVRLTHI